MFPLEKMQHRKNRLLEISTGAKSKGVFLRQMLTNLGRTGKVTTTVKRAQVLKSYADSFFSKLVSNVARYDEVNARRENIRYIKSEIFWDAEGKRVLDVLLPQMLESGKTSGFVIDYKLGYRQWDGAESILVKIA